MAKTGISKFLWLVVPTFKQLPSSADPGQPAFVTGTGRIYHYINNQWEIFCEGGTAVAPHASTHNFGGSDQIAANAAVATPSLRSIGTGATDAAAGNHVHALVFEKGGSLYVSAGITAPVTLLAWRAPYACTVTRVSGRRVGGGANLTTVNARRNGGAVSNHLAVNLQLTLNDTWYTSAVIQDATYADGDWLEWLITAVAGAPTEVIVQVNFTRNV